MTKKMRFVLAGLLSATAMGGAAVAADTLAARGTMRADTNRDGVVSRGEFLAAAEARFKARDANSDRTLTGSELAARRGRFARQDANNDGRISFDEATAATSARFDRLDADRDGKLVAQELRHRRGPGAAHGRNGAMGMGLRRVDTNADGRITREEMRAAADLRFDGLDANRDGVVDFAELRQMRRLGRAGPAGFGAAPPPPVPSRQ